MARRRSLGPEPEGAMWSNRSFLRSTVKTVSARVARSRGPRPRLSRKNRDTTASAGGSNVRGGLTNSGQGAGRKFGGVPPIVPLWSDPQPTTMLLQTTRIDPFGLSTRVDRIKRIALNLLQAGRFTRPQRQRGAGKAQIARQGAAQVVPAFVVHLRQLDKDQVCTALRVLAQVLAR